MSPEDPGDTEDYGVLSSREIMSLQGSPLNYWERGERWVTNSVQISLLSSLVRVFQEWQRR